MFPINPRDIKITASYENEIGIYRSCPMRVMHAYATFQLKEIKKTKTLGQYGNRDSEIYEYLYELYYPATEKFVLFLKNLHF